MSIPKNFPRPNTAGSITLSHQERSHEERNRETALYHANLIQERKDAQIEILQSTETLLEFPRCATSNSAHPAEGDIINVKKLLRYFQPSDYDSLTKERNIDRRCGYVLCPCPNRLQNTNAKYRILRNKTTGEPSLKFVEREELEHWCSDECGKRALHIRVQLSQEPAWTRPAVSGCFTLLEGDGLQQRLDPDDIGNLNQELQKLEVGYEGERLIADLKELAVERGIGNTRSSLMEVNICESEWSEYVPPAPPYSSHISNSLVGDGPIEGYTPKFANSNIASRA